MIHALFIVGEVKKITVSEPKDPKKNASAVLLVQYGPQRDTTGGAVEFVNAAMIRVPSYKYPQLKDRMRVGDTVQIHGHIQGVVKPMMDDGYLSTELVADHIIVDQAAKTPTAE